MTVLRALTCLIVGSLLVTGCFPGMRKGYRIENGEVVFYSGFPANRAVIGAADADSFTDINDNFGKDNTYAFYLGRVIPNADPATFRYLSGSYSKDKNNGYSRDLPISDDGANFDIVLNPNDTLRGYAPEGSSYARDSLRVYRDVNPIEGADPASFAMIPMFNGNYLTYDRRWVYFHDRPLDGVDGATFRKVSNFHFADKHGAWGLVLGRDIYWSPIEQVDLTTFAPAGQYYAKDKQRVYFSNYIATGADPATFTETTYLEGRDKNRIYSSGYSSSLSSATAKK